jgi:hypothetical protein
MSRTAATKTWFDLAQAIAPIVTLRIAIITRLAVSYGAVPAAWKRAIGFWTNRVFDGPNKIVWIGSSQTIGIKRLHVYQPCVGAPEQTRQFIAAHADELVHGDCTSR